MVTSPLRPMQPCLTAGAIGLGAGFGSRTGARDADDGSETIRKTSWRALLLGAPPRLG